MANDAKKSVGFNGLSDTDTLPIHQAVRLLMCCGDDNLLNDEFYPDGEIKDISETELLSVLRGQYEKAYQDAHGRVIEFNESNSEIKTIECKKKHDVLMQKKKECNDLIEEYNFKVIKRPLHETTH